ncbi:MAG: spermidine synthase [Kofleriaceae bacterium]
MIPTIVVERVASPAGEMVLSRRGADYSIRVAGVELMNSQNHGSEDELGRLTCAALARATAPRMLVGGLGLGYTLRAALDALPSGARVDVVEIVPEVVRWNRTVLGGLAGHPLDDPRVTVIEGDVARVIQRSDARYHSILLDVDNGPDGISESNNALYRRAGLAAAFRALVPDGVLAVWSSFESPTFTKWLRDSGIAVDVVRSRPQGARHVIWLARRPAATSSRPSGRPAAAGRPAANARRGAARPRRSR